VGILGLSYKPDTGVVEASPGIDLARRLAEQGHAVVGYDPEAMPGARAVLGSTIAYAESVADCALRADVLVIAVPWGAFRALTPADLKTGGTPPTVVDCWRILPRERFEAACTYVTLGTGPAPDRATGQALEHRIASLTFRASDSSPHRAAPSSPGITGNAMPMTALDETRVERPLVSIVTPVLNGAATIEQCLDSVRDQDYAQVEHVVVDGGSTDGTTDILRHRRKDLARWISEPDHGTATAFNKGLKLARGEILAFLNADDWYEPDAVSRAVAVLQDSVADFTYGAASVHGAEGQLGILRPLASAHWRTECLFQMPVSHVSMFMWRGTIDRIGHFDVRRTRTSDHDQFIRLVKAGCRAAEIDGVVGHIRTGGKADSLWALFESWSIAERHGASLGVRSRRWARYLAAYLARRSARHLFGERWGADLLARTGSRHASI
jgi:glycosyltransferase involved in cell wall biosynthesis